MTHEPQPTKRERREAARAERIERERADAAAAARKKRLGIFGAILVAAVAVVVVAIALSSGEKKEKVDSSGLAGTQEVLDLYKGIRQDGITLGEPSAKATVIMFADPKCPYCRDFDISELPGIVNKYVRTGKAKVELRLRTFIGPDSLTAAQALYGAGLQGKLFQASGILYHNQGEEQEEWATEARMRELLAAVPGLDVEKAIKDGQGQKVKDLLGEAETLASRFGSNGTPDLYVGRSVDDAQQTKPTEASVGEAIEAIAG